MQSVGEGAFLRQWGRPGSAPSELDSPIGVQTGQAGEVSVVDSGNERVQVFSQDVELLRVCDDVGPGPQIISLNDAGESCAPHPGPTARSAISVRMVRCWGSSETGCPGRTAPPPANRAALYGTDTANGVIRTFERSDDI